jgi:hypothetical protein
MESVLAKSTASTYTTGNKQYIKFCSLHSISDPYPAQEDYLLGFITYLYMHKKAASTIHVYLYAIRYHQLYAYNSDPLKGKHKIEAMVRAIKRIKKANKPQRIPVTIPLLTKIKAVLDMSNYDHQVLWASLVLGVYGLLRTSELAQEVKRAAAYNKTPSQSQTSSHDERLLLVNNVKLISDTHFILVIRASKTDPYRMGAEVHYFANHTDTIEITHIHTHWY